MENCKEKCKECKNILRPMAAQIFGHLYEVESKSNYWTNDVSQIEMLADRAVLAASCICGKLNDLYGTEES